MIQDIAPHQFHNEYRPADIAPEDILLIYHKGKALVKCQEEVEFFSYAELKKVIAGQKEEIHYGFFIDRNRYYLLEATEETASELSKEPWLSQCEFVEMTEFRRRVPLWRCFAGVTGGQLNRWYQNERFCSRCAVPLIPDKVERALKCPACHKIRYPVISPCVIVAVTWGDRLLLTRYARNHSTYKKYALIAGFAEIGESIEETVHREVMEEVGLRVKNLRFYKSQPWSFTDTLLFGFFAELEGDGEIHMDPDELSEAGWFSRDEITQKLDGISLTNEMIRTFRDGN